MIPLKDVTRFLVQTNKMNIARIAGLSAIAVTTVSTLAFVKIQLDLYKAIKFFELRRQKDHHKLEFKERNLDLDTRRFDLDTRILDLDTRRFDLDTRRFDHEKCKRDFD